MNELESFIVLFNGKFIRVYKESTVDRQIAELKEQIREERSAKVDYKISSNDLSEGLAKAYADNRRLKRALYKALANWAHEAKFVYDDEFNLWDDMEHKCLAKVEEYRV